MSTGAAPQSGKKKRKKGRKGKAAAPPPMSTRPWWIAGVAAIVLTAVTVWAWPPRPAPEGHVVHGNELYGAKRYRDALGEYESAPGSGPRNAGVQLDRGLARYRNTVPPPDGGGLPMLEADAGPPEGLSQAQEELRTAARGGTTSATEDVDAFLRARAAYDLANTFFSQHHWDNAIDAYKEALRLRPSWQDAAWNLELARRLRDLERNPPDAGQDAGPDAADSGRDGGDSGSPDGGAGDSGPGDSGRGDGDGGGESDSGTRGDAGSPQNDAGNPNSPDAATPSPDAAAPRTMAPLDDLDRSSRSLQNEIMRRRGVLPRSPDEDR